MRRREFIAGLASAAAAWPIAAQARQSATPEIKTLYADAPELLAVQYGAGMNSSIAALAARNNAMRCDAVCRARVRGRGSFEDLVTSCRGALTTFC